MQKLMIGFAGETASGKGVATELIKQWYPETPSFRFSDPLREFYGHLVEHVAVKKDILVLGNEYVISAVAGMLIRSCGQTFGVMNNQHVGLREYIRWLADVFIPEHHRVWTSDASTHDLQSISTAMRRCFGADVLERAIIARVEASSTKSPLIVIEGIRRESDIATLLKNPSTPFGLVYIDVDARTRYARHRARAEKPGDELLSFAEFCKLGNAEAEREIARLRPRSHAIIDNSAEPAHLEGALRMLVKAWLIHGPYR